MTNLQKMAIVIGTIGTCLSILGVARADPTDSTSVMDSADERAKVLIETATQFVRDKNDQRAYDSIAAAHKLQPTLRTACFAASAALQIKADVKAAEHFRECVQRAAQENHKQRNPASWKAIQADYEAARSRVGVLRMHAPAYTALSVDDQDMGFADSSREIFVSPNVSHTISGTSFLGTSQTIVRLDRGEERDVFLKLETKEPPTTERPQPPSTPLVPLQKIQKPSVLPAPAPKDTPLPSTFWFSASVAALSTVAALILYSRASGLDSAADDVLASTPGYTKNGGCPAALDSDGRCSAALKSKDSADELQQMSLGFSMLAASFGGTALWIYFTQDPSPPPNPSTSFLMPRSAGFVVKSTW